MGYFFRDPSAAACDVRDNFWFLTDSRVEWLAYRDFLSFLSSSWYKETEKCVFSLPESSMHHYFKLSSFVSKTVIAFKRYSLQTFSSP